MGQKMKSAIPLCTSHPSLLPPHTYIYSIIPIARNAALAAIASDDSLRCFDCATLQPLASVQLQPEQEQEQSAPRVHDGVTCLRPFGAKADGDDDGRGGQCCVLTAGRDGLLRGWDFRLGGGARRKLVWEMGGHCKLLSLPFRLLACFRFLGGRFSFFFF